MAAPALWGADALSEVVSRIIDKLKMYREI